METLKKRFPHLHLNPRTVRRTVDLCKKQAEEDATSGNVRITRRRASFCGGQGMILTPELAAKLVEINEKNWGKLLCKKLAGKLTAEGFPCSVASVHRWCKLLGATRRRRYIKPKLTSKHRLDRLSWVLSFYQKRQKKFVDNNITHGDEKWFYLMRNRTVCRVFPRFARN